MCKEETKSLVKRVKLISKWPSQSQSVKTKHCYSLVVKWWVHWWWWWLGVGISIEFECHLTNRCYMVHIWVVLNFAQIDGTADYKMKCHHHQHHRHRHTGQDASSSDRGSSKKQTWQTLSENAKKEQPRNGSNIMLNKSLIYFWFERGFWFLSRIDRTPHPLSATKCPVLSLTGGRATSVFGGGLAWLR